MQGTIIGVGKATVRDRGRERESKGGRLRRRHFCLSKYYTTRLVAYLQSTFSIPLLLLLPLPATTRSSAMQTAQKYAMKIKLKLVGNEMRGSPSSAPSPVCIGQLTFVIMCVWVCVGVARLRQPAGCAFDCIC